jgi:hypothetical protein
MLGISLTCLVLGFLLFPISSINAILESEQNDSQLDKVLGYYWSWFSNSPEDAPEKDPKCSMGHDTNSTFVFLLNPFETGDTNFDCSDEPISKGTSIFFPLITSFCSQGDKGLYGHSYQEISTCAKDLDRGLIKGIVMLDNKEIVNVVIDNGDGISTKPIVKNNLEQNIYYKNIFSKDFIDLLVTNNTTIPNNWERPEEFQNKPTHYKAVVHAEGVIIDTNDINNGNHTLKYSVDSTGNPSSVNLADKGWQFVATTTYKFNIK